ncbi:MAG: outer membrane protein assembly factor BamD [Treponema sp.]|jgi:hypothetical protein|nr:outer membrane protein assembly factor BamD [Treponema sp.]
MKYFFLFSALIFLFSCKGTPQLNDELPDPAQSFEIEQDEAENFAGLDFTGFNIEETYPVYDEEPLAEEVEPEIPPPLPEPVLSETQSAEEIIAQPPEIQQTEEPLAEEVETEIHPPLPEPVLSETQSVEETIAQPPETQQTEVPAAPPQTQSVEETIAQLPETQQTEAPVAPPPAQEQVQPSSPSQTQTPAQTQTQAPTQTQPSASPQTQPPAQAQPQIPPASLAPAEDRVVQERNPVREQRDLPPVPAADENQFRPIPQASVSSPDDIVFSRVVRATVGQIIEIPFRGTGWVYLGELSSSRGISYNSTRRETDGQSIIFLAEEAGTYVLKFYRENFIAGYILNDHVQVIIGEAPAAASGWFNPQIDRGRVVAEPRWPSVLEEARLQRGSSASGQAAPSESAGTVSAQGTSSFQPQVSSAPQALTDTPRAAAPSLGSGTEGSLNENLGMQEIFPPETYLQRAREAFNAGNTAAAIALLDQFMQYYPGGSDEAYWLYGQTYEANSPNRNILLSLDYYRRLVREYPQSSFFNNARSRIAYLERFYINIQ